MRPCFKVSPEFSTPLPRLSPDMFPRLNRGPAMGLSRSDPMRPDRFMVVTGLVIEFQGPAAAKEHVRSGRPSQAGGSEAQGRRNDVRHAPHRPTEKWSELDQGADPARQLAMMAM